MQVDVEQPCPTWPTEHDEGVLARGIDRGTWTRGRSYAHGGRVQLLLLGPHGIRAEVRGATGDYTVLLRPPQARTRWSGSCTCPMAVDCKHCVAALLAARTWLRSRRVAAPAWESVLRDLVAPRDPVGTVPVALQLELREEPVHVRVRPVVLGASGRWVKTGADWGRLEVGYGTGISPASQAAIRGLLHAWRLSQPLWASRTSPQGAVALGDLGPTGWQALREAVAAGVALVGPRPEQAVEIAGPATVVLDVQATPAGGLVVRPQVHLDGRPTGAPLVGSPPHGLVLVEPHRLLLAPLDKPLDRATERLLRAGDVTVPVLDVPRFLARFYPALRQRIEVASSDGSVELPDVRPPHLALSAVFAEGHRLALRWAYGYPVGDDVVHIPVGGVDDRVVRDRDAERALDTAGLDLADRDLVGLDTARWAAEQLPALLARGDVTVSVTGTPAAYAESDLPPVVHVATRDTARTDWFDLSVEVRLGDERVPLGPLVAALSNGQPHLLLASGTWFALDRPELAALARLVEEAGQLADHEGGLRVTAYQAGAWDELVELGVVAEQSARWQASAGALLRAAQLPRPQTPAGLQAQLRPYQLDGLAWLSLLWDCLLGGVLADDMGLGKTLQTLALAVRAQTQGTLGGAAGPLLVVAPTSVLSTWVREAERFAPGLRCVALAETRARAGVPLAEAVQGADLVVTSYALLRLEADAFAARRWCGLVLDEAQAVKNRQSKTYAAARRVNAPVTLVLTGTPLENSLMDLWALLSLAAPGLFPDPQRFADTWQKPVESGSDPERLAQLRRRIRPLILRRTKEQAAPDLPPKVEQVLDVTLLPAHRRAYDRQLQRERQRVLGLLSDPARNRFAILRSLTTMRQMSLAPSLVDDAHAGVPASKLDVLLDRLVEVVAEGHRALVFSQFTRFLALARTRLREAGIAHAYLDGRTRDRPARIAEFTSGAAPVFLISLKAGGTGLTLVEADHVFVLDPWWNPATEAQAVDRAHRIGQTRTVVVSRLVAVDTVEEKVVALQARKRDLFDRVVDEGGLLGSALTPEDLLGLFG